jgi:two-component system chemotaxis sensor kinase CheA
LLTDDELRAQLIGTFKGELEEYMTLLNRRLLELERDGSSEEALYDAFRTVHNLKGAAGAIGFEPVSNIAHSLENLLGAVRKQQYTLCPPAFDVLYLGLDLISTLMEQELGGKPAPRDAGDEIEARVQSLLQGESAQPDQASQPERTPRPDKDPPDKPAAEKPAKGKSKQPTPQPPDAPSPAASAAPDSADSVRLALYKIDRLMADVGDLLVSKNQYEQRVRECRDLDDMLDDMSKNWSRVRGLRRRLQKGGSDRSTERLLEAVDRLLSDMRQVRQSFGSLSSRMANDTLHLSKSVSTLQQAVQYLRMDPIGSLFESMRRQLRDLGRQHDKRIELSVSGADTELDRQLTESLRDPLMHLIRNAVDHGLETPSERKKAGKKEEGTIYLSATTRGSHIVVEVSDDGRGVDLDQVKARVRELGWAGERDLERLSDEDLLSFLFRPGFSTRTEVTTTSGRGVGLDVVKTNVERMQGRVEALTRPGHGTAFRMTLPLTVATVHVLMVRINRQMFAIPTGSVERTLRLKPQDAYTMNSRLTIAVDERAVHLTAVEHMLGMPVPDRSGESIWTVLVLRQGTERLAFAIDELIGEQEVVIKSLGRQLRKVRHLAGGAIMGDGTVVLLLHPADLLRTARGEPVSPKTRSSRSLKRRILVVDDSITTRTLEKNILENAGYEVVLAKDGAEGFEVASASPPDLVIADVEMPKMNGFELARAIKSDAGLGHLPVILVTSLGSAEDRARGVGAGADAYIVKGQFDPTSFLELVSSFMVE